MLNNEQYEICKSCPYYYGEINQCMYYEEDIPKNLGCVCDNWTFSKPRISGNYEVIYKGKLQRDNYTTSDGGHWRNVGDNGVKNNVLHKPSSFRELGL